MERIKNIFPLYIITLTALWWFTEQTDWENVSGFFAWRPIVMQYTGVLTIGVMSVAMILAIRPVVIEPYFNGLDKMYRLHKWLGISGLVLAITHWLIARGPKWLIGWGLLERPARPPRTPLPPDSLQQFFFEQRHLAESIGEWAFYIAIFIMIISLVKKFPYRYFFKIHHLLAITYLALVIHTIVLFKFEYWSGIIGPVIILIIGAGSISAIMVLSRKVAVNRQVIGELANITRYEALNVLTLDIQLKGQWSGHQAGQFAFVTLHEEEGAHPFTLSSAWLNDGKIQFTIKALGDYTSTLAKRLRIGDSVKVEGPYGCFNFQGARPRQIWVSGGIGVTPFISRLKALAQEPDGKAINLFHATATHDPEAIGKLEHYAATANVQLQILCNERNERLDAQQICAAVPEWSNADVWFCGPEAFGQTLKRDLIAMGLPKQRFHQELFHMR